MNAHFLILFQAVLELLDSYPHDLCCFCSLIKQMRPRQTHRFKKDRKAMTTHRSQLPTAWTWCWPKCLSALSSGSLKRWSKIKVPQETTCMQSGPNRKLVPTKHPEFLELDTSAFVGSMPELISGGQRKEFFRNSKTAKQLGIWLDVLTSYVFLSSLR